MIIKTENLTKLYNNKYGCKDISIEVEKGEIFGFLGPNGAGKSTFVKTLLNLIFPTKGKAYIFDKPITDYKIRQNVGYLPERFKYQDWMTGSELLSFHYFLKNLDKEGLKTELERVLNLVSMKGFEDKKISVYSKGMQQRIGIAIALIGNPELIILDEPTSALDPIGRVEIRDIIKNLKKEGKTVLLNSHLLNEVELVCDNLAFINHGVLIKKGKTSDLLYKKNIIEFRGLFNERIFEILNKNNNVLNFSSDNFKINIGSNSEIDEIVKTIINNEGNIYRIKSVKSDLEELFINIIKEDKSKKL
jgi:ABC-2 type transport system ATP-binding protein